MAGDFLFGAEPSVADAYLFVMLLWADRNGLDVPPRLAGLRDRMMARASVREALAAEGLA